MEWSREELGREKFMGRRRVPAPRGGEEYFFFSKCKQIICWHRSLQAKEGRKNTKYV